jgi:hypothetical protein
VRKRYYQRILSLGWGPVGPFRTRPEARSGIITKTSPEKQHLFCPNCGATRTAKQKHCGSCGTLLPEIPACPHCGAEVRSAKPFCGICGGALASSAGTAPREPAPATPPPRPAVSSPEPPSHVAPARPTPKRSAFGWLAIGAVGLVAILGVGLVGLGLLDELLTSTPPDNDDYVPTTAGKTPVATPYQVSGADVDGAKQVLATAAGALSSGDTATFLQHVSSSLPRSDDIPPEKATALARAFNGARMVRAESPEVLSWEMTLDGETVPFQMIMEEGSWKIY